MNLNVFKMASQVKELETEKKSLLGRLEVAEKDLTEAQDVIGNFMVKQKEFDTTIDTLKKDHASQVESLTKEYQTKLEALEVRLVEAKNSTGKEAAQLLASIGVPPETVKESVVPPEGDVLAKFESLTGVEKTAFYVANKEKILKATGLVK